MGKVIKLSDKLIPPKSETFEHEGQHYSVTFDPNAPEHERWVWVLDYRVTYQYVGSCPTQATARQRANRYIRSLNAREEVGE
jgi:hypothetical protein